MSFSKRMLELTQRKRANKYARPMRRGVSRGRDGLPVVDFSIDPEGMRRITEALRAVPEKTRKGIFVKAFRAWAQPVMAQAKAELPRRTGALRRSVSVRVRRYRTAVWAAVGGRVQKSGKFSAQKIADRKAKYGRDWLGAGWRMHLAERGFLPGGLIRNGPRRGISTRAKTRVPGRGALFNAGNAHASRLPALVQEAVDAAIRGEGLR